MGRDWRMRRDDSDRMGRDDRDVGPEMRRGDRDEYRDPERTEVDTEIETIKAGIARTATETIEATTMIDLDGA